MVGVGEMIASAVVKQITSRLIEIAGDEIALQWKFKGEVDKMVEKMKDLEAVMHDADNRVSQGGDVGEEVGRWLVKLKSVAYDVEDLLDDLDAKNNEAKLKAFFSRDNQAWRLITRPHNLVDVRKRIEEIENERKPFNLVPQAQVERSRKNETFAAISGRGTSTGMQGRSAEKDKLVNLILRSEANEHISIIPIVGLGGIGKTTLAQSVFADKRVDIFDIRAWVHVSEKFDLLKIMRAIVKSIDANINLDNVTLQYLQDCLQDKLADKKYLIVLDDFWEEGGDNLEKLKQMLQHGSSGSRIIVTTRNQLVVEQMKTGILAHQRIILPVQESDQINLGFLPTNDCWELIKIRAFRTDDDPIHLEQIGYEIASKCGGVPLVANAFGQVMSEDRSIKAWQDIKVKMVDVGFRSTCQNGTLESLKLSYYYMKREFKICFAYLAAFPKGFLIDTNRLIQQWYALGYIYSEYDGESCINYLLGMSFLQISGHPTVNQGPVHANASRELTMHDLVHDLATIIIGDEFLVLDPEANGPRNWKKAIHCRHAELIQYQNQSNVFDCLPKKLRSLHIKDSLKWQLPPKAFSQSKYMRVLDLACSARQPSEGQSTSSKIMLPRSTKKLKLLRYLDATGLPIPSLSKSVHTLQNMETLIMSNCSLETLPDNICSLHKLRYLDLSGNRGLNKLPKSLGTLSKLSFLNLSGCFVLQDLPESICQLICLQQLDMSECRAIKILPDKFGSLPKLIFLNLSGCSKITKLPDNLKLESLEHMNLSNCHELENLPKDFGNLQRLGFLSLSDCYKVSLLPESFCQLIHLKFLDLSDCHELMELPECFGDLFELESLNLTSCCKLQVLPESLCKLSKLRYLNLSYCMRLDKLPSLFGGLKLHSLDISCTMSLSELPDSIADMTSLSRFEAVAGSSTMMDSVQKIKEHLVFPGIIEHDVHQIENNGCSSIVELAQLTCYEMRVDQLQNVRHPEDAERAKLRDKSDLRQLTLSWGPLGGEGKSVLEKLTPPRTLDYFFLEGYMSKDFPKWMSDISSYLPSLTFLGLSDLGTCDTLPPFWQLPNLRNISMENIPNVRKIGKEFFGQGRKCTKLRSIHLESLENLAELWTTRSGEENEEFLIPNLHNLSVNNCPKLKFLPYPPRSMFWYLENIDEIIPEGGFGKLSSSVVPFQMRINNCNFSLDNWDRLHHFPTLEAFQVQCCNGLRALPEVIRCFTSLEKLVLASLKELESLPKWLGCFISLQCVVILDCPKLTSFPEIMKNLTALKLLQLEGCKAWDILPEWIGQLTSLQDFQIIDCPNLTSLPESIQNLSSLTELYIKECQGLAMLPECLGQIITLQDISIINCPNLTSLPESMKDLSSLTELYIKDCQCLAMLPECLGQIISLQKLRIINCPNLTSLPESMKDLSSLTELYIKECQGLVMLPEGLGKLITLQDISIINCPNLTSLPESMKDLSSLTELYIKECQGLAVLPECLGQLITLQKLSIHHCPNLISLPESMKDLSSLKELWIDECQGLDVLPEWLGQLISLQELNIMNCPNLTSLPQSVKNLPVLKELYIWGCPILVERCQGEDADLISHIPKVTLHL